MERKNKDENPIFYKSKEEMDKPPSQLIEEIRSQLANIRGKLGDMRRSYGWDDRIEFAEGGLTCVISALHPTFEDMKRFEERNSTK